MNERLDKSKISTETIIKNIRLLSKEYAHLKSILQSYKNRGDTSSLLLTELQGFTWEDGVILDGQIRFLKERRGEVTFDDSEPSECPFHGKKNNDDPRSIIVKIDVKDTKKAIGHLEEIIESYRNRKHVSSSLLTMFEYFLSEYREMIRIKSSKEIDAIARID